MAHTIEAWEYEVIRLNGKITSCTSSLRREIEQLGDLRWHGHPQPELDQMFAQIESSIRTIRIHERSRVEALLQWAELYWKDVHPSGKKE